MSKADNKDRSALSVKRQEHTYMAQERQRRRSRQMRGPKTKQ